MKKSKLFFPLFILPFLFMQNVIAQDWPNLKRYQAANEALGEIKEGESRIVFMGNSITEGWGNDSTSFFTTKGYINRGISGQTTPQMLIRFRQDVVDLHPDVVVILAGINDIAHNTGPSTIKMIIDNLKSMAEIAHANGIKVILSSVLPASDFPWRPGMEPALKVVALNKLIKAYAEENDFIYLDYFSSMTNGKNGLQAAYTYDEVHTTAEGYKVMTKLAEAAIAQALNQ